jgi:hypothetical protein
VFCRHEQHRGVISGRHSQWTEVADTVPTWYVRFDVCLRTCCSRTGSVSNQGERLRRRSLKVARHVRMLPRPALAVKGNLDRRRTYSTNFRAKNNFSLKPAAAGVLSFLILELTASLFMHIGFTTHVPTVPFISHVLPSERLLRLLPHKGWQSCISLQI